MGSVSQQGSLASNAAGARAEARAECRLGPEAEARLAYPRCSLRRPHPYARRTHTHWSLRQARRRCVGVRGCHQTSPKRRLSADAAVCLSTTAAPLLTPFLLRNLKGLV